MWPKDGYGSFDQSPIDYNEDEHPSIPAFGSLNRTPTRGAPSFSMQHKLGHGLDIGGLTSSDLLPGLSSYNQAPFMQNQPLAQSQFSSPFLSSPQAPHPPQAPPQSTLLDDRAKKLKEQLKRSMAAKAAKAAAIVSSPSVAVAPKKEAPTDQRHATLRVSPNPQTSAVHEEIDLDKLISQYSTPSEAMQVDGGDSQVKESEPDDITQIHRSSESEGQAKSSVAPSSGSPAKVPIPTSTGKPLASNVSMSRVSSLQASNASMSEGEIWEEPPRTAKPPTAPKAHRATTPNKPKNPATRMSKDNQKSSAIQSRQVIEEPLSRGSISQFKPQNSRGREDRRADDESRSDLGSLQSRDYRDERRPQIYSDPEGTYARRYSRDQVEDHRRQDDIKNMQTVPFEIAVVPSLEQLLPHDQILREWLEVSGYHDVAYREKILSRHRRIAEIDAERSKLIAEIAAEPPIKGIKASVTPTVALVEQSRDKMWKSSGAGQDRRIDTKKRPYSDVQDPRDIDLSKIARIEARPQRVEDDHLPKSSGFNPYPRMSSDNRWEDREYDRFHGRTRERSESLGYRVNDTWSPSRLRYQDDRDEWQGPSRELVGYESYRKRSYDASYGGRGRGRGRGDQDLDEFGDNPGPFPREDLRPPQLGQKIASRKPYKDPKVFGGRRGDDTRFFIVKSFNEDNVLNCIEDSSWNTQLHVGKVLSQAFQSSQNVILVFSINKSKAFQGYARMESLPGSISKPRWQESINWQSAGAFKIRWLTICSIRFQKIGHLRNSYNENLPVLIGKDGQEIESYCGWALLDFIDAEAKEALTIWNGSQQQLDGTVKGEPFHGELDYE
ncbi:hypothetical protein BP5796_00187 [Coleophoma crateriformis]|uniref:YTH domain-containing protein n=1 Tax=Coleophoma crateriformis TaxID=565419 RepID=A0A3D8T7D4_9HELO|nr:hypothetical protein BP5796_00187 [Coleophoma crateriformis]